MEVTKMKTIEKRKTVGELMFSGAQGWSMTREVLGHHYRVLSRRKRELHTVYRMCVLKKGLIH